MKQFSFKRFLTLLQWSIVEERSFLINTTMLLTLGLTALMVVLNLGLEMGINSGAVKGIVLTDPDMVGEMRLSFIVIYALVADAVIMIGANMMFRCMSTKQKRISFLMLPASNTEKFLSRAVLVAGGGILMIFVSFILSDALRMTIIQLIFGLNHIGWIVPEIGRGFGRVASLWMDNNSTLSYGSWIAVVRLFCDFIFAFSLFMFFGVFIRKFSLVAAFIGFIIVNILLAKIQSEAIVISVEFLATVTLCIASYNIFTRMQVINNKIANL